VEFKASNYGEKVANLLALSGDGLRMMPLAPKSCSSETARLELKKHTAQSLFSNARSPHGALCGLYLYYSCTDDAHTIAQDLETAEGSFWHGIVHRQEPDPGNSGYWFRRVGNHPLFPALRDEAKRFRFDCGPLWDPFEFIDFCESARVRPGSDEEGLAMQVQLAEWQLLFDYCAQEKTR